MALFELEEDQPAQHRDPEVQLDYKKMRAGFEQQLRAQPSSTKQRVEFYQRELEAIAKQIQQCNSQLQRNKTSGNLAELEVAQTEQINAEKMLEMERKNYAALTQELRQKKSAFEAEIEKKQSIQDDYMRKIELVKQEQENQRRKQSELREMQATQYKGARADLQFAIRVRGLPSGSETVKKNLEAAENLISQRAQELVKKRITNVVELLSKQLRNMIDDRDFYMQLCCWVTEREFDCNIEEVEKKLKETSHQLYGKEWPQNLQAKIADYAMRHSVQIIQNHGIAGMTDLAEAVFAIIRAEKQVRLLQDGTLEIK